MGFYCVALQRIPLGFATLSLSKIISVKQMSGLVQEGTYGCVLSPPLPCKKQKLRNEKTRQVGKIIRIKNSSIELNIGTLVKSIPGWQRYYVIAEEESCDSKNFSAQRQIYERMCKVYRTTSDTQLAQLVSPYAGSTVRSIAITNSFDFIGSLRHVLEGVSLLNKQGICHYDLHDGNMLVDFRGTFRIIDFGSAFLGDQIDDAGVKKHIYKFSPNFPPETPEMSVQNAIYGGMTIADGLDQTMKQKRVFKLAHKLLDLNEFVQRRELIEFWRNDQTWDGGSWVLFFRTYWRKWDSWAIGVMFLDILAKCFLLPGFLQTTWPQEGNKIRTVLKGLLRSQPLLRMTAQDALDML
jgi:tRNA A-37 threonylcarbamoyl transferase component Bud32